MPMTEVFRIGRDAELKTIGANQTPLVELSLAYTYRGKTGEKRPTQWIEGKLWGRRAEALAQYLLKGEQVSATIEGAHIEEFDKKDNTRGMKLVGEIIAIELIASGQRAAAPPPPPPPPPKPAARPAPTGFDDMDDDIPFN